MPKKAFDWTENMGSAVTKATKKIKKPSGVLQLDYCDARLFARVPLRVRRNGFTPMLIVWCWDLVQGNTPALDECVCVSLRVSLDTPRRRQLCESSALGTCGYAARTGSSRAYSARRTHTQHEHYP